MNYLNLFLIFFLVFLSGCSDIFIFEDNFYYNNTTNSISPLINGSQTNLLSIFENNVTYNGSPLATLKDLENFSTNTNSNITIDNSTLWYTNFSDTQSVSNSIRVGGYRFSSNGTDFIFEVVS